MQNTSTASVSIQDYILNLSAEKPVKVSYQVVLENNTDFILSRKTLKTERELVILISQGLYYIRDKSNGSIETLSLGTLKSFFRDLKDDISLQSVHWMPVLTKDSAERIDSVISDEVFSDMCRHNVLRGITELGWYAPYWEQNTKLFIQLTEMFPTISDGAKYRPAIPLIFELDKRYGYNEALYFASQLVKSGIKSFSAQRNYGYHDNIPQECSGFLQLMEPQYNLNLRRLIDYLLFDLYAQGITTIDRHIWIEYQDYLEMQIQFYGKIREKYPAHLRTEHDVMTLKSNENKVLQQSEEFANQSNRIADLAYTHEGYCIVIPEKPQDLVEEGIGLSHCVGSYADRVIQGECSILFLRKTVVPSEPLVTLQLSGQNLCQAQGKNRRPVTKEERRFLSRWCAAKGLNLSI